MENASKAIIMAGGILISIVIISLLVLLFGGIGGAYDAQNEALSIKQIEEYNRKFAKYNDTKGLYGSELLSLANLADDYNKKLLDSVNGNIDDKFYTDNNININVYIHNIQGGSMDDEDGNKIIKKNIYGKLIKKYISGGIKRQFTSTKDLLEYNNDLVKLAEDGIQDAKSSLTELRSLPFVCITNDEVKTIYENKGYTGLRTTSYNDYGRIKEMFFIQVVDSNILNSTNY